MNYLLRKYYGVRAKIPAIWHKIIHPTHDLAWRCDDWDICCHTCNRIYWSRLYELSDEDLRKEIETWDLV